MDTEHSNREPFPAERTQIHVPALLGRVVEQTRVETRVQPSEVETEKPEEERKGEKSHTMRLSKREIVKGIRMKHSAYLEISGLPDGGGREFQLEDREVVVGRSSECELQLPLPNVSRRHARLFFLNEEYKLADLNSTNGTFVNGVRVSKCVLRNNDLIEIGEAKILFVEQKIRQS